MEGPVQQPPETIYCTNCGKALPSDSRFCQYCAAPVAGQQMPHHATKVPMPQMPPPPMSYYYIDRETSFQKIRRYTSTVMAWLVLVLFLECILNIGILLWGTSIVLPQTSDHSYPIFIIVPWLITLFRIGGWELSAFFIFLAAAIAISFVYMTLKSYRPFSKELQGKMPEGGHSPLFTIATLVFASIFFTFFVYIIAEMLGISVTTPSFDQDLWALILSLAAASVWEEVVSRVMLIGLPLLVVHLVLRKVKEPKRYLIGGNFQLGVWEIIFLLFSSLMFSMAHLTNWDAVKLIPTFMSGIALGYLFLRYGLYASIMMHFFVDYLDMPYYAAGKSVVAGNALGLFELILVVLGLACFIYYLLRIWEFMGDKGLVQKKRPAPAAYVPPPMVYQHPPPQQPQQYQSASPQYPAQSYAPSFVCKQCGGTEARYENGALYCTRCGKKD